MKTIEDLQSEVAHKDALILELTLKNMDLRIADLEIADQDKEDRLRILQASSTRFETLAWLAFGGGALSAISLLTKFISP